MAVHVCPLLTLTACLSILVRTAVAQVSGPQECSFPSPPKLLPLPSCQPVGDVNYTSEDAAQIAWKFAPIVYMHPKEPYRLQSPKAFFHSASLYYQDFRNSTETRYQFLADLPFTDPLELQWGSRQFATVLNSTKISNERRAEILAGAEVTADGLSAAEVYYTMYEPTRDMWGFTYNLFYSFNGCSQQMFSLGVNGTAEVLDMRVCPFGTHEADWERVSVLVCKVDESLKQVGYSQHAWTEILNCENGECLVEDGHPVTHAALESHANYPIESPFVVYDIVNASLQDITLINLGGLFLGDRTKADPSLKFVPTPANVIAIPDLPTILEGNLTEWEWAAFGGVWGGPLQSSAPLMECFYDNQTRVDSCPEGYASRAYDFGLQFYRKLPLFADSGAATSDWTIKPPSNMTYYADTIIGSGILGPLMRTYSYIWLPEVGPPVYSSAGQPLVCPGAFLFDIPFRAIHYTVNINTIINYLVGVSGGCGLFAMLVAALLALPALLDKQAGVKSLTIMHLRRLTKHAGDSMKAAVKRKRVETDRRQSNAVKGAAENEGAAGKEEEYGSGRQETTLQRLSEGEGSASDWGCASVDGKVADGRAVAGVATAGVKVNGLRQRYNTTEPAARLADAVPAQSAVGTQADSGAHLSSQEPLREVTYQQQQQEEQHLDGASQPCAPLLPTVQLRTSALQVGKKADRGYCPSGSPPVQGELAAAGAGRAGAAGLLQPSTLSKRELTSKIVHAIPPSSQQPSLGSQSTTDRLASASSVAGLQQQQTASALSPVALLPSSSTLLSDSEHTTPQQADHAQWAVSPPCAAAASAAGPLASPAASSPEFTAMVYRPQVMSKQHMVWAGTGFVMYAVGIGFLAHGTNELYKLGDHVRQYIPVLSDVFQVLKIVVAAGLSLTGLIDIVVIGFLFLAMPRAQQAWGSGTCRRGFQGWVQRNSYAIHVAMAVLLLVVISVAMVLFGMGMVVLVAQLVLQMICGAVSRVTLTTIPLESLCISLPSEMAMMIPGLGQAGGMTVICMWELINTCFYLSEFLVWDLVVGSALLLWSHLVFLVLVITSMWLHYQFKLRPKVEDHLCAAAEVEKPLPSPSQGDSTLTVPLLGRRGILG